MLRKCFISTDPNKFEQIIGVY